MTSVITNLNEGFEDGFHNNEPKKPDNDDYMFSYRVGQADRQQRFKRHLKEKRKTDLDHGAGVDRTRCGGDQVILDEGL